MKYLHGSIRNVGSHNIDIRHHTPFVIWGDSLVLCNKKAMEVMDHAFVMEVSKFGISLNFIADAITLRLDL